MVRGSGRRSRRSTRSSVSLASEGRTTCRRGIARSAIRCSTGWWVGSVLADADRVVGEDEQCAGVAERREADRRAHVVAEDEERRADRPQSAVQRLTDEGRPHRELADAVVDLATARGSRALEPAESLSTTPGVVGEVGRSGGEAGRLRRQRVHRALERLARGHPRRRPSKRSGRVAELARRRCVRSWREQPVAPCRPAAATLASQAMRSSRREREAPRPSRRAASGSTWNGSSGTPRRALASEIAAAAEGGAVRLAPVHHLGRGEADVRAHDDQRRSLRLGRPRLARRRLERVQVVGCLAEVDDVPAVGGEARAACRRAVASSVGPSMVMWLSS